MGILAYVTGFQSLIFNSETSLFQRNLTLMWRHCQRPDIVNPRGTSASTCNTLLEGYTWNQSSLLEQDDWDTGSQRSPAEDSGNWLDRRMLYPLSSLWVSLSHYSTWVAWEHHPNKRPVFRSLSQDLFLLPTKLEPPIARQITAVAPGGRRASERCAMRGPSWRGGTAHGPWAISRFWKGRQ